MKNKLRILQLLLLFAGTLRAENNVLDAFYPSIERRNHFWINADVLCFQPKEKSIVLTNKPTDLFTTANVTLQPNVKPHFKWDVGYRIGFGYLFPKRTWDITLNWTHFNTHVHQQRSTHGNIGLGMFPIWSLANDIIPFDWVSKAKMYWRLHLNLLDLDFGRAFAWRKQFFVRPFVGLRSAWINQNLNVGYGGGIFANGLNLADLGTTFGYDTITMKNNFWGIGPRIGLEPHINFGKGWRLYTSACGTLDGGFFKVRQKEVYLESVRYERNCSPKKIRWIIDATAGLMWKTFCGRDRYALSFACGWEYHMFFHQVELKGDSFGLVSKNRNLSLNGLAFSAHFDF